MLRMCRTRSVLCGRSSRFTVARSFGTEGNNVYSPEDRSSAWRNVFWLLPSVCFGLSAWQWKRLHWKQELIKDREERVTSPIQPLPQELLENPSANAIEELEFKPVTITGEFQNEKEFHVGPRSYEGNSGFHIVTPFVLNTGETILVNRGWVPYTMKHPKARENGQIEGEVSLIGLVRSSSVPSSWTPENNEISNYWFWLDADTMANAVGPSCKPIVVDLSLDNPLPTGGYPLAGQTNITLPNNHLNYTLTWGSLGIALSIMAFRFTRFGMRSSRSAYDAFGAHKSSK